MLPLPPRLISLCAVAAALLLLCGSSTAVSRATASPSLPSWSDGFTSRGTPLPAPCSSCQVCFYELPGFRGDRFCVGRRNSSSSDVMVIRAPSTIGSIQFSNADSSSSSSSSCDLVVNLRVLDPPYGRHIDSFSSDVVNTTYDNVVQELYVEKAGRACFLAALEIDDYGKCYDGSVCSVEQAYRDGFYEALLFESARTPLDVVVFEDAGFRGLSKRLNASTSDLDVVVDGAAEEEALETLQMRIRSIQFLK